MHDHQIPVSSRTRSRLKQEMQGAETYSDVINRLLDQHGNHQDPAPGYEDDDYYGDDG